LKEIAIRPATEADFGTMWEIFQELIASGDTYYFAADTSREDCHAYWFGPACRAMSPSSTASGWSACTA
jgi:hypothetical protein